MSPELKKTIQLIKEEKMNAQPKATQPSLMKALTLGVLLAASSMSFSTGASAAACAAEKWAEGSQYKTGNVYPLPRPQL
jgi:hypothetical protein